MAAHELGALEQVLLGGLEEAAIARLQLGARLEVARRAPSHGSCSSAARVAAAHSSAIFSSTIASKSASLLGKRRKTVALPTPARRAISAMPDVEALLGERLRRRLEDEAAVALGVRAQRALPDLGHGLEPTPPP